MLSQITNTVRKEFIDASRDHRSLIAAMTFAVMSPVMIYFMISSIAKSTEEEKVMQVALVGSTTAPTLIKWLDEREIEFTLYDNETTALAALGPKLTSALVISDNYATDYAAERPAEIRIYADYKRDAARTDSRRLEQLINIYGRQVDMARMAATGISPLPRKAISVATYDLSVAGGMSVQFSGIVTYLFLMAGFISGAFMAADSVAGERERHSLQPLLAQPVTPLSLAIGKWVVAALVSSVVSAVTIILGGTLLSFAPLAQLGLRFFTDPITLVLGAFCLVPLACAAASLQLFLASRAKTYREAATYAQYTMFLPIIIVGATQFGGIEFGEIANYLPITSQDFALRELLLEGSIPIAPILIGALVTLAVTTVFVWLTAQTLGSEKSLN